MWIVHVQQKAIVAMPQALVLRPSKQLMKRRCCVRAEGGPQMPPPALLSPLLQTGLVVSGLTSPPARVSVKKTGLPGESV
jgi:hypothetical protein